MIIAAFDVATVTGVCDGAVGGSGKPRVFSWDLRDAGDGRPQRLLLFARLLRKYFTQEPVDKIVYEAPLSLAAMADIGTSEEVMLFLRGAIGVLEMTCAERAKPVASVAVQDARESVLGWRVNRGGKKKKNATKQRVFDEVTRLHGIAVESDNEADAYVTWAYACARENPRLALAFTPLFRANG